MSKGSSYWSTARGKIGDTVVSIRKGQRIERKYQPVVSNPKTASQMIQRARFANAVKFYQDATSHFFRFAYEDKKQTETDFNAFMRHNVDESVALPTKSQLDGTFPAMANNWELSHGSLVSPVVTGGDYANESLTLGLYLGSSTTAVSADASQTVGELSTLIKSQYGLEEGDILTFISVYSPYYSTTQAAGLAKPTWVINQVLLDSTSTVLLDDALPAVDLKVFTSDDVSGTGFSAGTYAQIVGDENWDVEGDYLLAGVVFSRKSNGKLLVSESHLIPNTAAYGLWADTRNDTWTSAVLQSWGANGDAILQGGYVYDELKFTSPTLGSTGTVTTIDAKVGAYSVTISGTGLSALTGTDFTLADGLTNFLLYPAENDGTSRKFTVYNTTAAALAVTYAGGSTAGGITWSIPAKSE